jgi:5-methyltetrahydrofolate--homocysteine methyltransferase
MSGLRIMNDLTDPAKHGSAVGSHIFLEEGEVIRVAPPAPLPATRSSRVRTGLAIPPAPSLDRCIREVTDLPEIWTYLNSFMLYSKHLGFQGNFAELLHEHDPKAIELHGLIEAAKEKAAAFMTVRTVCQFFEAERDGNAIHLFAPGGSTPLHSFTFPRQPRPDGLCLSDFVLDPHEGERDHIALFVVTAGEGVRKHSEDAKKSGEFLLAHALQAIAVETAEAAAEWLHRTLREDWGFPDPPHLTMQQRFTAHYHGKRYSPGFPACPNLDDQQGIWKLLRPEEIGVSLTENMMMDPEASVSALVFHHPDCTFFSAADDRSGPGSPV